MLAWLAGRQATAGALAGLACLIKPQLGLLVVWALLRRRTRFAAGWFAVVTVAGLTSLLLYREIIDIHIERSNTTSLLKTPHTHTTSLLTNPKILCMPGPI